MAYFRRALRGIMLAMWLLVAAKDLRAQANLVDSLKRQLSASHSDTTTCRILYDIVQAENNQAVWPLYNKQLEELCERRLKTLAPKDRLYAFYNKYLACSLSDFGLLFSSRGEYSKSQEYHLRALSLREEAGNSRAAIDCLWNLGHSYYREGQPQPSIGYYRKALEASEKLQDTSLIIQSLDYLAGAYQYSNDLASAKQVTFRSIKLRKETGDQNGLAENYSILGIIYYYESNIPVSLDYSFKSLKIRESIRDTVNIAQSLNNIAAIYQNQENYTEALAYYTKSLKLAERSGNKERISQTLNNIATCYNDNRMPDEALAQYLKNIPLQAEIHDKTGLATSYSRAGILLQEKGEGAKAIAYCRKGLELRKEINDKEGMAWSYLDLGNLLFSQKNYKEAESYYQESLALGKALGYPANIQAAAYGLKKSYKKSHQYGKALDMYELYIKMKDSTNNETTRKAAIQSQLRYEYEKKMLADSVKNLEAKKVSDAKLSESNARVKQEQTQKLALYGGLALILVFTGFIFNRFRITQKQKNVIEQQKIVVDESQRKIIDSINYARKIQDSILPSTEELDAFLPGHFIFFKPKDIVSGDFYWFHRHEELSFFAVADCTGHGVPGAFMTMIAHAILIEVVVEQQLTSPEKILEALHHLVFKMLQQKKGDEYSQDGLDISFCTIDHKKSLLHFSGARNSAYLTDGREICLLKATPKSIGGLSLLGEIEPERQFKLETVELRKDMLLVLTSDGILDQLNGQDEKFGTTRFKQMILEMYNNSPRKSIELAERNFLGWKGSMPQLDDVLLAGIRF